MRQARRQQGLSEEEVEHFEHHDQFPHALADVWAWFVDLCQSRPHNGWAPGLLTYTEIAAWAGLRRLDISPWEVEVLRRLDALWMEAYAASRKTEETVRAGSR